MWLSIHAELKSTHVSLRDPPDLCDVAYHSDMRNDTGWHARNRKPWHLCSTVLKNRSLPDSKVHGANMGRSGAERTQVGPMLAPWTLLSGYFYTETSSQQVISATGSLSIKRSQLNNWTKKYLSLISKFLLRCIFQLHVYKICTYTIKGDSDTIPEYLLITNMMVSISG